MKTIAIIDNFDSFVYNLVRYLRECPDVHIIVQRNNAIDYAVLDRCDAVLLSPGPGIPDEAGELKQVIRRYSGQKPLLGVCLGHQAIAEVFGSDLEQCSEPVHGKATLMFSKGDPAFFSGLPDSFPVGRYHSWQVKATHNSNLEFTGITDDGTIMALRHREHPTRGVQFHPESILTPHGRQLINNWIHTLS